MSARLLLEIALRVLGIWFFFTSITGLTMTAALFSSNISAGPFGLMNYFLASIATIVFQLLLGASLVYWAPSLAARFYPPESDLGEVQLAVGPGDVYRTASFVLGAYLLVATAHPAGRLVSAGFGEGWHLGSSATDAVTLIVYVSSGLLLIFGSRRIAEVLSTLGYDPDSIPKQQISIRMLLVVVVFIAVLLGVVRIMSASTVS